MSSQTSLATSQTGFTASNVHVSASAVELAKTHEVTKFSAVQSLRTHTRSHSAGAIVPERAGISPVSVMGVVLERSPSPDAPSTATRSGRDGGTGVNETAQFVASSSEVDSRTRSGNETQDVGTGTAPDRRETTDPLQAATDVNPVSFVVGESRGKLASPEVGGSQPLRCRVPRRLLLPRWLSVRNTSWWTCASKRFKPVTYLLTKCSRFPNYPCLCLARNLSHTPC